MSSINLFSSPGPRPSELLPSGFVRRPSYVVAEFTPVVSVVRVSRSLVLCVMFCRLLFVLYLFLLAIVLSILLRFTSSDFGIMNLKTSPKIQSTNCKICKQWYDKPSKIENIHDDSGGHKSNKRKQRNSKNVYKPYD